MLSGVFFAAADDVDDEMMMMLVSVQTCSNDLCLYGILWYTVGKFVTLEGCRTYGSDAKEQPVGGMGGGLSAVQNYRRSRSAWHLRPNLQPYVRGLYQSEGLEVQTSCHPKCDRHRLVNLLIIK